MTQQIDPMHRIAMMAGDIHSIATENESAWQHDGIDTVLEYAKKIESLALAAAPAVDNREKIVDSLNQSIESWHEALGSSGAIIGGSDLDPVEQTFGEFAYSRLPAAPAADGVFDAEFDKMIEPWCIYTFPDLRDPDGKWGWEQFVDDLREATRDMFAALAGGPADGEDAAPPADEYDLADAADTVYARKPRIQLNNQSAALAPETCPE